EEKAGRFCQEEGKEAIREVGDIYRLGVHGDLISGHAAEHAVAPKWKMAMCLLVFERVMGHSLPLQDVFLFKDLIFEGGAAIDDRHHHEHGDGDEVRKGA